MHMLSHEGVLQVYHLGVINSLGSSALKDEGSDEDDQLGLCPVNQRAKRRWQPQRNGALMGDDEDGG